MTAHVARTHHPQQWALARAPELLYALSRDPARDLLPVDEQATMWQACALALFTLDRMPEALDAGRHAVRLREELGDAAALGEALVALATSEWVVLGPRASVETAERAVRLLDRDGDSARRTWALAYLGLAADEQQHSSVLMGHVLLAERLWQLGRVDEVEQVVDAALAYAGERDIDLDLYLDALAAHRFLLAALRGDWGTAETGLRGLLKDREGIQVGAVPYRLPHLARLLVRRGADDAAHVLGWAVDDTARAGWRDELIPTVLARLEQAWLTGQDVDQARESATRLLARLERRGSERARGELLRWLHRLGDPAAPGQENDTGGPTEHAPAQRSAPIPSPCFDGCPEEFAAGLRGDWRAAADAWERIGAPYERALDMLDSHQVEPTLEALAVFDALGAAPAARVARRRLRALGVRQVPRGPHAATPANPAGLTDRQVEILTLLRAGLSNTEIAERLVVSVRTVDHHVSAVLQKLGVTSRRDAAAAAVRIGMVPTGAAVLSPDPAGPPPRPPRAAR